MSIKHIFKSQTARESPPTFVWSGVDFAVEATEVEAETRIDEMGYMFFVTVTLPKQLRRRRRSAPPVSADSTPAKLIAKPSRHTGRRLRKYR